MEKDKLYQYVDHTALRPYVDWDEVEKLCQEAERYHMASVCIPGSYVRRVREHFPELTICTVVGFPLGYANTASKLTETDQALTDGADEIDMVINLCDVKNGDYAGVQDEIHLIKGVAKNHILKVIIETCYLTRGEKLALCNVVTYGGADYIKTSTGFGTAGATPDDVRLLKKNVGSDVKVKAAGGIRTREEMEALLEAGASRIGTSAAIDILEG